MRDRDLDSMADADLGSLVTGVVKTLRRRTSAALGPWRLSPHQSRALGMIARHSCGEEELRLSGLAEHLRIAPRSATEVVDALEERGLVLRSPSPSDRRAVALTLTDAGRELRAEIDKARSAHADDFFAVLSEDEQDTLRQLLTKALTAAERD